VVLLKKLKSIFSLIAIVLLTVGIYILIVALQEKLFVPQEYIMWVFKYPANRLVFIYVLYFFGGFLIIFFKDFRETLKNSLFNKRRLILSTFIIMNIILFYTIIFNVTVITNKKIIDYSFLSPEGREYSYNDVVKVNTGVYGKKSYLPYKHSKGDFFYIIELDDGSKIDLTELGEVKNDEHPYFIIEKLDIQFVDMGIPKVTSMENFEYSAEHLDHIYSDKIRNILENTN
jgi:hypothetical protein